MLNNRFLNITKFCLLHSRHSSSSSVNFRGVPLKINILDPWIPLKKSERPFFLSKNGIKYRWVVFKHWFITKYSNREIKKHVKDWNPAAFAVEAQQLYIDMNKAYLSDNKAKLATLVTMPMFDKLKALIEHQKNVKFVWKFEGEVEKPKLVYTRLSKAQFDAEDVNKTHMIVQCTVRVHTKQCILVYNNNKLINKENKIRTVLEHIIIERIISIPGSKWQIAGKADLLKIEDNEKYKKKI